VSLSDWIAEVIRLTIFPVPGAPVTPENWWKGATGADPETRTVKPATREHVDEGPFDNGRLVLSINPVGVIQWQLLPSAPVELVAEIPSLGPLPRILDAFAQLTGKWLPECPPATRLGLGVIAHLPVSDHDEAYRRLGDMLNGSVRIDPQGSSEFLYRINRPRSSRTGVPDLRINRLSTWIAIKMSVLAGSTPATASLLGERYACRADLDINTVPTFKGTLSSSQLIEVSHELRDLAAEIVDKGDVP